MITAEEITLARQADLERARTDADLGRKGYCKYLQQVGSLAYETLPTNRRTCSIGYDRSTHIPIAAVLLGFVRTVDNV